MEQLQVTNDDIRQKVVELLPSFNLQTTGIKQFVLKLSDEFGGIDLKAKKAFIKQVLKEEITKSISQLEQQAQNDIEPENEENDDDHQQDRENSLKPKRPCTGGLSEQKEISDALHAFLQQEKHMSRTQIVKQLWKYIHEHKLQNPQNKQEILLDDKLRDVFGCDKFTMFTMNKHISAHIHPFKAVDLTTTTINKKRDADHDHMTTTQKKRRKKRDPDDDPKRQKKERKPAKQPYHRLSNELQAVVGVEALPRFQVVSKLWDYIKTNNLQDPADRRQITCDEKLKKVMRVDTVSMFNMNQYLPEHILERVEDIAGASTQEPQADE